MTANTSPAIYCYSKTGHTRRVAEALAHRTGAEVIEIEVDRYKVPMLWFFRAIWDVGQAHLPPLRTGNVIPTHRPWSVLACPIWADQPAAPARSAISALAATTAPIGLLTTSAGSSEPLKCVATCEAILGRPLAARINIQNKVENTPEEETQLAVFADAMSASVAQGAA